MPRSRVELDSTFKVPLGPWKYAKVHRVGEAVLGERVAVAPEGDDSLSGSRALDRVQWDQVLEGRALRRLPRQRE
jgi:hypothetical protein